MEIYRAYFDEMKNIFVYELENEDTLVLVPRDMDKVNILYDSIQGKRYSPVFDEPWCEEDVHRMIIGFKPLLIE